MVSTTALTNPDIIDKDVIISLPGVSLRGRLTLPVAMPGLVIFAHGSGSSWLSPRNRRVADAMNAIQIGTLVMDMMAPDEAAADERTGRLRFDMPFLATRLEAIVDWVVRQPFAKKSPIGLFGASTGAAAALIVAGRRGDIAAVVSRGGRPDLAVDALETVTAPVLLIVGGNDAQVLDWNREALKRMSAPASLDIIPDAGHLFEEGDALATVARHAADWFLRAFHKAGNASPEAHA